MQFLKCNRPPPARTFWVSLCITSLLKTVWMFLLLSPSDRLCHWQMQSRIIGHIIGLPCLHCIFSQKWIRISLFVTKWNNVSNRCIWNHLTTLCCIYNWILTAGSFKHLAVTISNIGFFKYFYSWSPLYSLPVEMTWFLISQCTKCLTALESLNLPLHRDMHTSHWLHCLLERWKIMA